jgi:hypothetical protein
MFHHVVLVRFKKNATTDQIDLVIEKLRELPKIIPAIMTYVVEKNAGINAGAFDLAIVGSFADVEAYRRYQSNPTHRTVGIEYLLPLIEESASIQYSH